MLQKLRKEKANATHSHSMLPVGTHMLLLACCWLLVNGAQIKYVSEILSTSEVIILLERIVRFLNFSNNFF